MTYFHPTWLAHQRKRFTRPDAYRLAPPGTPEARPPGWLDPSATRVRWKEAQEAEARAVFAAEVKRLQAEQDRLCAMLAEIKYDLAWRKLCRKYGYNPDQPRDELGRWTDAGGGANTDASDDGASSGPVLSDASPDSVRAGDQFAKVIPICMLGSRSISTDPHGNQSWWADYVCADGFTFRKFGTGGKIRGFWPDPR